MLELPNGTITVLHTDVQDSTPDAARGAVRRGIGDPPRPLATWVYPHTLRRISTSRNASDAAQWRPGKLVRRAGTRWWPKGRPSETRRRGLERPAQMSQVPHPNATRRNHQRQPSSKCVMLKVVEGKGFELPSATSMRSARVPLGSSLGAVERH